MTAKQTLELNAPNLDITKLGQVAIEYVKT